MKKIDELDSLRAENAALRVNVERLTLAIREHVIGVYGIIKHSDGACCKSPDSPVGVWKRCDCGHEELLDALENRKEGNDGEIR